MPGVKSPSVCACAGSIFGLTAQLQFATENLKIKFRKFTQEAFDVRRLHLPRNKNIYPPPHSVPHLKEEKIEQHISYAKEKQQQKRKLKKKQNKTHERRKHNTEKKTFPRPPSGINIRRRRSEKSAHFDFFLRFSWVFFSPIPSAPFFAGTINTSLLFALWLLGIFSLSKWLPQLTRRGFPLQYSPSRNSEAVESSIMIGKL